MIPYLKYLAQKRRGKLVTYLNSNNDELPLEKQHQIYGAITELDQIMIILSEQRQIEMFKEKHPDDVFLIKPLDTKSWFQNLVAFFRDLF